MPGGEHILAVEGLTKDFGPVRALHDVTLGFRAGEVHGIVGENGAGKSTLVKVLAGIHQPGAGRVVYRGEPITISTPAHAVRLGIAMVHQELNLVDELSAADNVFLGRELATLGFVSRRRTRREAACWLARAGSEIDPDVRVRELPVAQRQMVEIAKALSHQASVLILDEPTAVLTRRETTRLLDLIGRLRSEGVAVIYISHILPEVLSICDRITVMRDGRVVRTLRRGEAADEAMLGGLMVGRTLGDHFPPHPSPGEQVVLSVRGLSTGPLVRDVSLDVRAGEIVGLAGLVGAGRTEFAEAVVGIRPRLAGTVSVRGRRVDPRSAGQSVAAGLAYLSEDRRERGLVMGRSIADNVTLVSLRRYSRLGLVSVSRQRQAARRHAERLGIRMSGPAAMVDTLSGGNQQKVLLAKWLEMNPSVLILDEPTRGVDIGAKEEIYRLIADLAGRGMACVFISSELNELLGTCHRICVMRAGRMVRRLCGEEMTENNVMLAAVGVGEWPAPSRPTELQER